MDVCKINAFGRVSFFVLNFKFGFNISIFFTLNAVRVLYQAKTKLSVSTSKYTFLPDASFSREILSSVGRTITMSYFAVA